MRQSGHHQTTAVCEPNQQVAAMEQTIEGITAVHDRSSCGRFELQDDGVDVVGSFTGDRGGREHFSAAYRKSD